MLRKWLNLSGHPFSHMLERKKAFVSGTVEQTPIEPKFPTNNKFNSGQKIFFLFLPECTEEWTLEGRFWREGAEIWKNRIAILQLLPWEQASVSTKWQLRLQHKTLSLPDLQSQRTDFRSTTATGKCGGNPGIEQAQREASTPEYRQTSEILRLDSRPPH